MRGIDLIKEVTPPVLIRAARSILPRENSLYWEGDFATWDEAVASAQGYGTAGILESVASSCRKVRDGQALWERDSVCFNHEQYDYFLLASLMRASALCKGALHVLDFGGSLGSTYIQHRKMLQGLSEFSWSVVEQKHFVELGEREFRDNCLNFFETIEEAYSARKINVIVMSSVLQYLAEPYMLIKKLMSYEPVAIIIARTPLASVGEKFTVQHVPKSIYQASYPCRFLDRVRIESLVTTGRLVTPWERSSFDPLDFFNLASFSNNVSTDN